jgi:hypothetical protein
MPNVVPHVPDPDAIPPILFYIAAGVAGGVVGIGFMITYLATWGRKLFSGEKGDPGDQGSRGDRGDTGAAGKPACPFEADHPAMLKFMGESTQDRRDMREFIKSVDVKVEMIGETVIRSDEKLKLILKKAKIVWNGD